MATLASVQHGGIDYYALLDSLQHTINPATGRPYTGAEAVGMAARDAVPSTVPASAQQYLKSGKAPTLPREPPTLSALTSPGRGGTKTPLDPASFGQAWTASGGRTTADLAAFVKAHPEYGAQIVGSKGDKVTIGGQTFDAVKAAGEGGRGAQWLNTATASGGGTAANPLAQPFSYPAFTGTFAYQDFKAPTLAEAQAMPGFQFGLQQGEDALTRSAAARGSALNTGTLKDLQNYAQNYANQAYGNLYNQDLNTYLTNRQNALGNFTQQYQQYLNGLSAAQKNYAMNADVNNQLFNQAYLQSQAQFDNQFQLADLGLRSTLAGVNAGQTYANNAGNLATQSGNAAAAGSVGAGNAINGALGNLANLGTAAYLYSASPYGNRTAIPGGY